MPPPGSHGEPPPPAPTTEPPAPAPVTAAEQAAANGAGGEPPAPKPDRESKPQPKSAARPDQPGTDAPPQNLEAEESVLGAMMLAPAAIAAVRERVTADEFYRHSHSLIYQAALELYDRGDAVDYITVTDELEKHGLLEQAGGKARVAELAVTVPATANAWHYAEIVHEHAVLRELILLGGETARLGWERPGELPQLLDRLEQGYARVRAHADRRGSAEPFVGLTHPEVLAATFDRERELVEDIVAAGACGAIVGVPEVGKSWLAQAIAFAVAAGHGEILGRHVASGGTVGYWWQDDATRDEAERVQLYAKAQDAPDNLPIHWYLNQGLSLPRDLARLRSTIEEHNYVLTVVDSLYNVAEGDLKDRDVGKMVAAMKAQVCDPTGCTVLFVDHMPWATDVNRGRLRSYGDVFKSAAWRFAIYIDSENDKLYIEARGNNMRGFKKTLAAWDDEKLELRLIDSQEVSDAEHADRVLAYLAESPWATASEIESGAQGRGDRLRDARRALEQAGLIVQKTSSELGRPGKHKRWNLSARADQHDVQESAW